MDGLLDEIVEQMVIEIGPEDDSDDSGSDTEAYDEDLA